MNDLSCFSDLGGWRFAIASVFVIFGMRPSADKLWPNQFTEG